MAIRELPPVDVPEFVDASSPRNSFAQFVNDRVDDFLGYQSLTKQQREVESDARRDFAPIIQQALAIISSMPRGNEKRHRQIQNQYLTEVFNHARILREFKTPDEVVDASDGLVEGIRNGSVDMSNATQILNQQLSRRYHGKLDAMRAATNTTGAGVMLSQGVITADAIDFETRYFKTMGPMLFEIETVKAGLETDFSEYCLSNYQALVDMLEFLSNPAFAQQREVVRAFLRDFIAEDTDIRRSGKPGQTSKIREEWQGKARESFEPVVFERFWIDITTSQVKTDVIEWMVFAARGAKSRTDEAGISTPTPDEIKATIARVAFEFWPESLRKKYSEFVLKDIAGLVEGIRTKMQQLFPKGQEKQVYLGKTVDEIAEEEVTNTTTESDTDSSSATSSDNDSQGAVETNKKIYRLAIIDRYQNELSPRNSNWVPTGPMGYERFEKGDEEEQAIARLSKNATSPQMREDFAEVIRLLLEDPYRVGTKKMVDRSVGSGSRRAYWRRLDPGVIREMTPRDPETRRFRVIYIVFGGNIVGISTIIHHNNFDKLGINDHRAF